MPQNNMLSKEVERKLKEGRVFRDMEMRAKEDEQFIVEGYATTFNEPYELYKDAYFTLLEQVDARAFDECDMSDVIMQYDHEGRVFARISNKTLQLKVDDHGLKVRADLSGTEIGRQLYEEIKGGYTTKMSFAFRVSKDKQDVVEDYDTGMTIVTRTILGISKTYDVSAVSLPANDATEISARSYSEGVIAEIKKERLAAEERRRAAEIIKARIRILAD